MTRVEGHKELGNNFFSQVDSKVTCLTVSMRKINLVGKQIGLIKDFFPPVDRKVKPHSVLFCVVVLRALAFFNCSPCDQTTN